MRPMDTARHLVLIVLAACTGTESVGVVEDTHVAPQDNPTESDPPAPDTDVDADTDETDLPVPACVVGTGETTLTPLSPGDEAVMYPGSQGRFHVWGAVTCVGVVGGGTSGSFAFEDLSNPQNPLVTWEMYDADHALIGGYQNLRRPMTRPAEVGIVGEEVVVWIGSYAENVGREVLLRFHLVDALGVEIEHQIPLRLASNGTDTGTP